MAVRTGATYKAFVFDGVNSRDYGVYITGEAVYNVPARDVELITVPGRNGAFTLDKGRYENIEVTYPAGLFGVDEADFATTIANFRNALASRTGYKRLYDEYNPDEYRQAVYASGLDVTPAALRAGEFNITFNCKPQRWLLSGENPYEVSRGGAITNPTLLPSSPLIIVDGYGTFDINGQEMEIISGAIGPVQIAGAWSDSAYNATSLSASIGSLNTLASNDRLTVEWPRIRTHVFNQTVADFIDGHSVEVTATISGTSDWSIEQCSPGVVNGQTTVYLEARAASGQFYNRLDANISGSVQVTVTDLDGVASPITFTLSISMAYDYTSPTINEVIFSVTPGSGYSVYYLGAGYSAVSGVSSLSATGVVWIDTEIGQAYVQDADTNPIFVNNIVRLPAELPTLSPGENVVNYANTIQSIDIIPRWWQL